jgi:hypothetical protein
MDEILKWAISTGITLALSYGMFYVSMRNSLHGDPHTMVELQQVADNALKATKAASQARDEAVAALEEYKAMRVADFQITITFSLHPTPLIKDVTIKTVGQDGRKTKPLKIVKMVEK